MFTSASHLIQQDHVSAVFDLVQALGAVVDGLRLRGRRRCVRNSLLWSTLGRIRLWCCRAGSGTAHRGDGKESEGEEEGGEEAVLHFVRWGWEGLILDGVLMDRDGWTKGLVVLCERNGC